jgi:glycine hydroxymethyltransferase
MEGKTPLPMGNKSLEESDPEVFGYIQGEKQR